MSLKELYLQHFCIFAYFRFLLWKITVNPSCHTGPSGVTMLNDQNFAMPSLQLIQKLQAKTLTKCLNSLLPLHKLHTQLNIFGFNFLDLLKNLMKMMLLYILFWGGGGGGGGRGGGAGVV